MIKTLLLIAATASGTPQCQVVGSGELAACYSVSKVDAAYALLKGRVDRDFIVSIEMNRGSSGAEELAEIIAAAETPHRIKLPQLNYACEASGRIIDGLTKKECVKLGGRWLSE